jgi:hypothetical protein
MSAVRLHGTSHPPWLTDNSRRHATAPRADRDIEHVQITDSVKTTSRAR